MVKFIDVAPEEIPNFRESHRGRVSYPILKSFLESNKALAQLDRTGMQQGLQSLNSCLNSYIRNHDLPIKMFTRRGEIYLARTDVDENGTIVPRNLTPGELPKTIHEPLLEAEDDPSITPVTTEEALARYTIEENQTTK